MFLKRYGWKHPIYIRLHISHFRLELEYASLYCWNAHPACRLVVPQVIDNDLGNWITYNPFFAVYDGKGLPARPNIGQYGLVHFSYIPLNLGCNWKEFTCIPGIVLLLKMYLWHPCYLSIHPIVCWIAYGGRFIFIDALSVGYLLVFAT